MSNFQSGVYELHAIDQQGISQRFAVSAVLESEAQLAEWFNAEVPKHQLPANHNWYYLDIRDSRFQSNVPVVTAPAPEQHVPQAVATETVAESDSQSKPYTDINGLVVDEDLVRHIERQIAAKRKATEDDLQERLAQHMAAFKG